ncbi:WecB/TagA/CpsF family glycosyltransferase [Kallotenue papyrolyticum]|uniref:WecB/TagA/CpsF family glycosyltransferase n=1 Tax=Kallotenue papyrolyticum TaxID=1325125 RepID=UPI0004785713|nr:WecB/TagA/CpsF family glycosyltransferase [Kallotenue papyrolyticum]
MSGRSSPAHARLLGVRIDDVDMDEAVARIEAMLRAGGTHHVVTVNPEFVMTAQRHPIFREVLCRADLAVPDGTGLLLAARLTGQRLRRRVPGVELCERLAALSARTGARLFLLGAAPGIAEAAAATLQQRFPGVVIAGCYAGSPRPEDEATIRARLRQARPDILLVAYGSPAQDLWIARNQPELGIPVALGVGGSFDYLSGAVPRAPRLMRRLGLEWFYRLLRQPWRWQRIWTAVVRFPLAVLREHCRARRHGSVQ